MKKQTYQERRVKQRKVIDFAENVVIGGACTSMIVLLYYYFVIEGIWLW